MTRANSKIRVLALDLEPIYAEYELETRLAPTEEIRVLEIDFLPICPVYGLEI